MSIPGGRGHGPPPPPIDRRLPLRPAGLPIEWGELRNTENMARRVPVLATNPERVGVHGIQPCTTFRDLGR